MAGEGEAELSWEGKSSQVKVDAEAPNIASPATPAELLLQGTAPSKADAPTKRIEASAVAGAMGVGLGAVAGAAGAGEPRPFTSDAEAPNSAPPAAPAKLLLQGPSPSKGEAPTK